MCSVVGPGTLKESTRAQVVHGITFDRKRSEVNGKDEPPRSQSTIYIYEVFQELNMTEVTQISRRATSSRVGKVHNRVSVPCHYRLSLEQG